MTEQELQELQSKLEAKRLERDVKKAAKLGTLAAVRDREDYRLRLLSARNAREKV